MLRISNVMSEGLFGTVRALIVQVRQMVHLLFRNAQVNQRCGKFRHIVHHVLQLSKNECYDFNPTKRESQYGNQLVRGDIDFDWNICGKSKTGAATFLAKWPLLTMAL